ncbi:ABC transporter permease [Marinobacterium sp. xm-m-383]|uniref:ABC transporter permease n=2 Tax=unclassified Marinobacterium TaxID=2644139 RepID=UPI0019EE8DED|nr:Macrolide export ATP-binding/permease protein MacB [Marinobacterium sp. xm-v-242]NRP78201.1 Macrolide export ATP-binding/permease protein MacB [Marinobacterium sp. xm-m-383]
MLLIDHLRYSLATYYRQAFKALMILLSVSIGVMSVVLLTGLSEGARQFVYQEFSLLGKEVLIVLPGRKETEGGIPPVTGEGTRDLTLDDAKAIHKLPQVNEIVPIIAGITEAHSNGLNREIIVLGTNQSLLTIFGIPVKTGTNLTQRDVDTAASVTLLGSTLAQEIFPNGNALGGWVKFSDRRYRVIGIIEPSGINFGTNMNETALIPVTSSQTLFNAPGLFRMLIKLQSDQQIEESQQLIEQLIMERHQGERDITIVTQNALLNTFSDLLNKLTLVVIAIASISLLVAGILIMNITLISVSQRVPEIGLLKALGASHNTVTSIFLLDSILVATTGAIIGVSLGIASLYAIHLTWPSFPFAIPYMATLAALLVSLTVSLIFTWLPAKKAATVDPVAALRGEINAYR